VVVVEVDCFVVEVMYECGYFVDEDFECWVVDVLVDYLVVVENYCVVHVILMCVVCEEVSMEDLC